MRVSTDPDLARLIRQEAEPFSGIEEANLDPLLDRIGSARVVLLGEASHGTSEFYRMRARITRELITRAGFSLVAVEADWPDARWVDGYGRHATEPPSKELPFKRFPRWMWRNQEVAEFDTLETLLAAGGPGTRAVVWEHNSHIGDAAATEMGRAGQLNVGRLCREAFGSGACLVGFGTDHGTVAAAPNWDEPMQVMQVRPSHPASYERIFHNAGLEAALLPLRAASNAASREELLPDRLERAIGVIYRPATELASHYFRASLPEQFDEYIWFDQTSAVAELAGPAEAGLPDTYPFGL